MGKKILTLLMVFVVCLSTLPAKAATIARTPTTTTVIDEEEIGNGADDSSSSYVDITDPSDPSGLLLIEDINVYPAKKTIRIGQSFYINIVAANEMEWDIDDEEWDELIEDNVDSIVYRSSKTSIASVNRVTGKVVGKKKGSAVIKTTINLVNGQTRTFKTKVYVTK